MLYFVFCGFHFFDSSAQSGIKLAILLELVAQSYNTALNMPTKYFQHKNTTECIPIFIVLLDEFETFMDIELKLFDINRAQIAGLQPFSSFLLLYLLFTPI